MKIVGRLYNAHEIEIVEIDGEMYALYGWNTEEYTKCWKVLDKDGIDRVDEDREYTLRPVYEKKGEDDYEVVDYVVSIN